MSESSEGVKRKGRRWARRLLRVLAVGYLLFCVACASLQRRLIYFPPVFDTATADQMGRSQNLQRWNGPSGAIGWERPSPTQPARGIVLVVHGNAGAAVQCGHYADVIQRVAPFDVYLLEYPGYGDRPGKPTEKTLEAAAEEGLHQMGTNSPIYVVGESLGTGVACWLAGKHPDLVAGVALIAPYNSLTDVAQAHEPLLPVHLLLCDRFPAETYLRSYNGPIAVLVGGTDRVVPEKFGRRLYDGYAGPKRLWEFPEDGHGDLMLQPAATWEQIIGYLTSAVHETHGQ